MRFAASFAQNGLPCYAGGISCGAPKHPYPAGITGSLAAIKWLKENAAVYAGISDKLAVAGDSAGGYMALLSAQKLHAEGTALKAQFTAYPVTNHYSAHHASGWLFSIAGFTAFLIAFITVSFKTIKAAVA